MKRRLVIGIAIMCLAWGGMMRIAINWHGRNIALELTVQAYKDRFAQRLGEDKTHGTYKLLTLDGGLTWWEFDTNELPDGSEAVMVIGRADADLVRRLNEKDGDGQTH